MKKTLMMIMAFSMMSILSLSAAYVGNISSLDRNGNGIYEPGEVDPCKEYQSGPCYCYCPTTRFKPEYYCTTRCVQEPYTVPKRCCRMVPKYYEQECCRMVPQKYTQTYCKYVPEYYCVNETKYRTRQVRDTHCRYQPYTYVKKTCCPAPNNCAQPQADCCVPQASCCTPNQSCCGSY